MYKLKIHIGRAVSDTRRCWEIRQHLAQQGLRAEGGWDQDRGAYVEFQSDDFEKILDFQCEVENFGAVLA